MRNKEGIIITVLLLAIGFMAGALWLSPPASADSTALTGVLPREHSGTRLQNAQKLQFIDATGTPIYSPKTSVSTTPQAFKVPAGAINMIFRGSAAIRYGDNTTLDGSSSTKAYMAAAASTDVVYPVAGINGGNVYVAAETGTVSVFFFYEMLQN